MSTETQDALLHSQLQEGLHQEMSAPAVSGTQNYKALCLAAKNEERRLAELQCRKQYHKSQNPQKKNDDTRSKQQETGPKQSASSSKVTAIIVVGLDTTLTHYCHRSNSKNTGRTPAQNKPANIKQVKSDSASVSQELVDMLYSSSDEETDICSVRVTDKGSQPRCAPVQLQGVPVFSIIDSGADIMISGGSLFRKVATTARLKKRDLKKPD